MKKLLMNTGICRTVCVNLSGLKQCDIDTKRRNNERKNQCQKEDLEFTVVSIYRKH